MVSKYAWPSSVNVSNFVTVNLNIGEDDDDDERSNSFSIWKEQMVLLLESQDVAGFVNGDIHPPPNPKEELEEDDEEGINYKMWRRTDRFVKGWILGSIGKDLFEAVWYKETAREVWLQLHNIFTPKPQQLQHDIGNEKFCKYMRLYQAALRGDWETAEKFFEGKEELGTTIITSFSETPLHLAILTGNANDEFLNKLLKLMPRNMLAHKNLNGETALHSAVIAGNTVAASALVKENPDLLNIPNKSNHLPILKAVFNCQKETLQYLISEHEARADYTPFQGQQGITLLVKLIYSEFVDIAFYVAQKYPDLTLLIEESSGRAALTTIAGKESLFLRTETFYWWQKLFYHLIPTEKAKYEVDHNRDDLENPSSDGASNMNNFTTLFQIFSRVGQKLESLIWYIIQSTVPKVKEVREKKANHQQTLELAQYLCDQILVSELTRRKALQILEPSVILAAGLGISEIVEMVIHNFPMVSYCNDPQTGSNLFMLAASFRFEKVINLMYNMSDRKYVFFDNIDIENNNLMHICGKIVPTHRLNLVAGAALQMQRELQWFKEMENFVRPPRRHWTNDEGQTPQMIFTKEHEKLKIDGEKWMEDTANACTIAAALIATVMFAAAFTVPGGLESTTGVPLFTGRGAFQVFAVSDAISLFSSVTSLLTFLSILTARYAEEDFLYVLPKRLSIGLLSLFVSIAFMLVAFSSTLHLVLRRDIKFFVLLLSIFACFPLTSLVILQSPLFVDVVYSTYGPGIFRKKGNSILY